MELMLVVGFVANLSSFQKKILKVVERKRSALNNFFNFCIQMDSHLQNIVHEQNQVEMG